MKLMIGTYRKQKHIPALMDALEKYVSGIDMIFFVDDSGDDDNIKFLEQFGKVGYRGSDREPWGFSGSMRVATSWMNYWRDIYDFPSADPYAPKTDHYCWWEEDFLPTEPIDLELMSKELRKYPDLAQIALVRQPVYEGEKEHGTLLNYIKSQGTNLSIPFYDGTEWDWDHRLLIHNVVFTTNPAVWAPSAYRDGWPEGEGSEALKTKQLKKKGLQFAYLEGQQIEHVGEREGTGY